MGARETLLVKLADENGRAMEIYDPQQAAKFLSDYVGAINRPTTEISALPEIPRIGNAWQGQGGVYAGTCRGVDGRPDHHLFVHADEKESIKWKDAVEWAKGLDADGHKDFSLPTRKEQAVLFGNVPELFQPRWYWSGQQHAEDPEWAWMQHFITGTQLSYHIVHDFRARAVRRLIIQ